MIFCLPLFAFGLIVWWYFVSMCIWFACCLPLHLSAMIPAVLPMLWYWLLSSCLQKIYLFDQEYQLDSADVFTIYVNIDNELCGQTLIFYCLWLFGSFKSPYCPFIGKDVCPYIGKDVRTYIGMTPAASDGINDPRSLLCFLS